MDRRNWKYPFWYYGMIVLTLVAIMASVYLRGSRVQTDFQLDRFVLGSLMTILVALATWAFNRLINEIRNIGSRMGHLTDAIFKLEIKLHPDNAALIMESFQAVVRSKKNGEFRDL
jgi:uncharacterized BrkB/YihY/UPF0761 family membrane protein